MCVHADIGRAVELEVASETEVHSVSETAHHCLVHLAVVAHLLRLELCVRHVMRLQQRKQEAMNTLSNKGFGDTDGAHVYSEQTAPMGSATFFLGLQQFAHSIAQLSSFKSTKLRVVQASICCGGSFDGESPSS